MQVRGQHAGALDTQGRRGALYEAALSIVREHGFGAATVKAVTRRAGVSAGLLYRYVDGIEDLLTDVFRHSAGIELSAVEHAVRTAASQGAPARLCALSDTFARRALRGRKLAWALLAEPVGSAIDEERLIYRKGYAALAVDIVRQGVQDQVFVPQDPQITAAGIVGAIGESLIGPLSPVPNEEAARDRDDEQVVTSIRQLCLRAVGATQRELQ